MTEEKKKKSTLVLPFGHFKKKIKNPRFGLLPVTIIVLLINLSNNVK
jgi:hypothetical protein